MTTRQKLKLIYKQFKPLENVHIKTTSKIVEGKMSVRENGSAADIFPETGVVPYPIDRMQGMYYPVVGTHSAYR